MALSYVSDFSTLDLEMANISFSYRHSRFVFKRITAGSIIEMTNLNPYRNISKPLRVSPRQDQTYYEPDQ